MKKKKKKLLHIKSCAYVWSFLKLAQKYFRNKLFFFNNLKLNLTELMLFFKVKCPLKEMQKKRLDGYQSQSLNLDFCFSLAYKSKNTILSPYHGPKTCPI